MMVISTIIGLLTTFKKGSAITLICIPRLHN